MRIVMNKPCLIPTFYRLGPAFLLFSFLITGCAEIRHDCSKKYTVGQHDDATAHYTLGQNAKAKIYTVGQYDDATAQYTLRQGSCPEPQFQVLQANQPKNVNANYEEQVSDLSIVLVASDILFAFDKWVIKDDFLPELDQWVDYFQNNPQVTAIIAGHTDSTGPTTYNQKLSEKRAQAVINYLIGKGVAPERLTAKGFGESRPAALNTTSEGRQKNRRVELNF
ncbi:MAG: OmpA family protein [Proteobacteria bacterium]|nr:OmpA family protein [Pseudomonadota bacterium]